MRLAEHHRHTCSVRLLRAVLVQQPGEVYGHGGVTRGRGTTATKSKALPRFYDTKVPEPDTDGTCLMVRQPTLVSAVSFPTTCALHVNVEM